MIYMMIIFQSPFFFPGGYFSFHFEICFSFLVWKKSTAVASTKKRYRCQVQSSLQTRPEQLLEALEKVQRWWWGWWGWVASKHGGCSSCSLVNFDMFPTFFCCCKRGVKGGKIPRIFFVGSIISEFWKHEKTFTTKWWEFGGRDSWDPLVQGNLGWWNFPQAWRPWRNGSNVRRSKASLGDPRISVFGGDFCGEIQKSGGSW